MPHSNASPPAQSSAPVGPVDQLEKHVSDDWWKTLFGPLYLMTDADVLKEENTEADIDHLLRLLNLTPDDRILDLCCGQGRHALALARRGFKRVEGVDQSDFLIEKAQEAANEAPLNVPFHQGDGRSLSCDDHSFDAVIVMGNSFGYFESQDDNRAMLEEVRRVLKTDGQLLLDVTNGAYMRRHFEPRSWEWIDQKHLACRERELVEQGKRLISREIVVHVDEGVLADQFYGERLYDRSDLHGLLQETGFGLVGFSDGLQTRSDRDQDLGMMTQRVMVTATPDRRQSDRTPAKHVAVILGDPHLPDGLNLSESFGEQAAEVIDRLKEALSTLEGYHFNYLSDHSRLREDLELLKDDIDFVFNLCDEGFKNDPRKELHVPVLLEMLDVPYTGSTPQCLAHCYDKSLVRGVAREMNIPVPAGYLLEPGHDLPEALGFGYPMIVKPNTADSSIGITQDSVAESRTDLEEAIASVREAVGQEVPMLIEQFLTGKDMTVSLVGNGEDLFVLPITEDSYSHLPDDLPPLCGFEAKWLSDSPYAMKEENMVPVQLEEEQHRVILGSSERLFQRLGCRDYARFDWRLSEDGQPCLLEANPNPGWSWDGHMIWQGGKGNISYAELLERILEAATRRIGVPAPAAGQEQTNGSAPYFSLSGSLTQTGS